MLKKLLSIPVITAFIVTFFSVLVYTAVQQSYRMNANDPQIQLAEDLSVPLANGEEAPTIGTNDPKVDLVHSLSPFFAIFDETGKLLVSSADLNGTTPEPPKENIEAARTNGQNRFTWQPAPNVRIATVIAHYQGEKSSGFVLVGRSLREVEKRQNALLLQVAATWLASILLIGAATFFQMLKEKK